MEYFVLPRGGYLKKPQHVTVIHNV